MEKPQHQSEKRTIQDRQQRRDALAQPEHFYPRPQDVLDDDSLSADDKRSLLDNWQVALEDKAGSLGQPLGPDEDDPRRESRAMLDEIAAARKRLDAADG